MMVNDPYPSSSPDNQGTPICMVTNSEPIGAPPRTTGDRVTNDDQNITSDTGGS